MVLSNAPNGASFAVVRVTVGKEVGKRLADMGFTEGTEGAVVRSGFFHGPLQVRIRGYDILIRRYEAAGIEVDPVGDWSAAEDASHLLGGRLFGGGSKKYAKSVSRSKIAQTEGLTDLRSDTRLVHPASGKKDG
jgi:ferrous iron transport protein A